LAREIAGFGSPREQLFAMLRAYIAHGVENPEAPNFKRVYPTPELGTRGGRRAGNGISGHPSSSDTLTLTPKLTSRRRRKATADAPRPSYNCISVRLIKRPSSMRNWARHSSPFLPNTGKTPSTKIRINTLKARRRLPFIPARRGLPSDASPPANHDAVVNLMVAVAKTLPVKDFQNLRDQLEDIWS
jgi:hypothetical protein